MDRRFEGSVYYHFVWLTLFQHLLDFPQCWSSVSETDLKKYHSHTRKKILMAGDKIVREDVTETELFRIPTKFIESHRFFSAKKFRSAATGEKKIPGH